MSGSYSKEELEEINKILLYIQRMNGIVRTSPNRDQVERVKKEIRKLSNRLAELVPGVDPARINMDDVRSKVGLGLSRNTGQNEPSPSGRDASSPSSSSTGAPSSSAGEYSILDRFPVRKASPNSTDHDINFMATALKVIQNEYWPVLSDQVAKVDFSNSATRDNLRVKMDNVDRNLKVLTETIEEYANAEKQDFREQLLKMKSRQSRLLLFEGNEFFKELERFLSAIVSDMKGGGQTIMNKNESVRFDARFQHSSSMEGRVIQEVLEELWRYVQAAIHEIRIPDLR